MSARYRDGLALKEPKAAVEAQVEVLATSLIVIELTHTQEPNGQQGTRQSILSIAGPVTRDMAVIGALLKQLGEANIRAAAAPRPQLTRIGGN